MKKLKSRKFWLCCASLLGSVAAAIAGFATDNQMVIMVGVICGVISTSIYTVAEALIDCEKTDENLVSIINNIESITENDDGSTTIIYREED